MGVATAHPSRARVAWESDPGTVDEGAAMSVFRVAARPVEQARARASRPSVSPVLGRAAQALAVVGAFVLGIAIALMLPGAARAAEPAPAGVADAYIAPHTGVLSVDAANGVLANDLGSGLVAEVWTEPDSGDLLLASDGGFIYTPTSLARSDSFEYLASDPDGLSTEPVKVTIHLANRPPECDPVTVEGSLVGAPVELDLATACSDPDGDALTFAYQEPDVPAGSLWQADNLGHVRFDPPPDWTGYGTVLFTASDGLGSSMQSALSIEVVPAE